MRRRAAALLIAGALALVPVSGCAALVPRPVPAAAVECDPPAPPGATDAARAYTDAAHRAHEARVLLSDTIAAQDMMMSLDDLRTSAANDEAFLAEVRGIDFPPEAARAADDFVRAVEADDDFLLTAAAQDGYYAEHAAERNRLYENRTRAGHALREALGLPRSGCSLNLP